MLISGLRGIKVRTNKINAIRTRGLMVALELKDDAKAFYTTYVQIELVRKGYILAQRPGLNILRLEYFP